MKMNIHVDYSADHDAMTFEDTKGEPIVSYRASCTTGVTVQGRPVPDGWVLSTNDGEEYITGVAGLTAVDEAVANVRAHLTWMAESEAP